MTGTSTVWSQTTSETASPQKLIRLTGTLKERGTRKALSQVNIYLLPHKLKATTDAAGKFSFDQVPAGVSDVVVNLTGYIKLEKSWELTDAEETLNLFLEKEVYSGFETTVVGKAQKRDDQQKSMSQKEFLSAPGAGGDPVKAVQNLAGINRPTGGSSQVVIQGAEPQDTKYSVDGHEIPIIFHFGGLSSVMFPEAVDSVNLYPAGYGPEYGRAIGGQISLLSRDPKKDRWHGLGFVDLLNMGGMTEGPIDEKQSILVAGRYSYIGAVFKKIAEKSGDDSDFGLTVAPTFYDLTVLYTNQIDDRQKVRVTALTSSDKMELVLKAPPGGDSLFRGNFYYETSFFRFIPQYTLRLSENSEINASIGFGRDNIVFDVGDSYFRLRTNSVSLRSEYITKPTDNWKTFIGFDNQYVYYKFDIRLPDVSNQGGIGNPPSTASQIDTSSQDKVINAGVFWRNEIQVSQDWTLIPGLRVDYFRTSKETAPAPKFAVRYKFSEDLTYRFATGLYYQPPSGRESDANFGNPDLKSPRALHFNLGFDKDFRAGSSDGHTVSGGLFYKKLDRLVTSSSARVVRDGVSVAERYNNEATGRIQGLEATWKLQQQRWSTGLAYTYSQSYRTEPGQAEYPSQYDQTHNLNLMGSYDNDRWLWTGRCRYVTGSPFTPVLGSYYDSDQDVYVPFRGEFYSQRKPSFTQLDIRGERKVIYDTWIMSFYIDVQNILNQKNVESVEYSFNYNQRKDVTGLGMLPTFGVKGEF